MTIGGKGITGFAGINGPLPTSPGAMGVALTGVEFGLALLRPVGGGSPDRYYALKAAAASVESRRPAGGRDRQRGIGVTVEANGSNNPTRVVDFSGAGAYVDRARPGPPAQADGSTSPGAS